MIDLDDTKKILETQGGTTVIQSVDALPKQLQQSFREACILDIPPDYKTVETIVVCGMGGSRFPSLILQHLFKEQLTIPYLINDDYILPEFVNEKTLVILSSYSGTTEEVIHCGTIALQKKAKLMGITAGGDVAKFLKKNSAPCYVFDPVHNPSGQPRIGFGYAVGGHLGILLQLGVVRESKEGVEQAIKKSSALLSDFRIDIPKTANFVKQLAETLYERYPYYVVSEFLTGVGNAVANQTNETAKSISSFRVIPELNHHLMEGLKHPAKLQNLAVFVLFFSKLYSSSIQKRFHITKEIVEKNGIQTAWYELKGKTKLEQVFELMGLGSYLSLYLAALYEEDPTLIPYVDYFKKKLKEM